MIEEINIEINKDLKQRGNFDFVPFESTITTDLFEKRLKVEKKIYHCSSDMKSPIFVDGLDGLPILKGYYQAYVYHIPICISPDILWMLFIQGISRHINLNSEKLRNKFVNFEDKKTLVVNGDEETIEEINQEGWERTIKEFVQKIKEHVGDQTIDLFSPTFTTSTPLIQIAKQVAIMSSFQSYFNFVRLYGGCGFPYIKLQGTVSDFTLLKSKIQGFMGYDIDDWIKELLIIMDKIIETKKGKIDKSFWENIIKNFDVIEPGGSGDLTKVTKIDGWLLNFYPFVKSCFNFNETLVRRFDFNKPLLEKQLETFPLELIDVPLIMLNKKTFELTELVIKTGILGMIQDKDGIAKGEIGWFITNKIDRKKLMEDRRKKQEEENKKDKK